MDRFETIRDLMADLFGVPADRITTESSQDDIPEWDSISHLNLMLALEDAFGVSLDVEDIRRLRSVNAILKFVESACPSK
jgi:acyl carrier protein